MLQNPSLQGSEVRLVALNQLAYQEELGACIISMIYEGYYKCGRPALDL